MRASAYAQALTVTAYEIRKYLRGRRLLGMLLLLGVIVALLLGLPPALGLKYATDPNAFVASFANFTGILVVLAGVLFAADALVSEHEKRTGYFLFPNPVRREVLVLGKLAASLLVSAVVVSLYYGAAAVAALVVTGSVTWEIGLSYVYALAYMLSVVGVAFLISSALRTTTSATVLTFFLFMLIFNIVQAVLPIAKVNPWFIPTAAAGIISHVLSPTAGFRPPNGGGEFITTYVPDVTTSLVVFTLYFIAASLLAILLFRRRELSS